MNQAWSLIPFHKREPWHHAFRHSLVGVAKVVAHRSAEASPAAAAQFEPSPGYVAVARKAVAEGCALGCWPIFQYITRKPYDRV